VILLFRLSKNLIIVEKVKFSKTMLSGSAFLIIIVYIFLVIGYFSD
jgi:hypothetical protein